LSHMDAKAAVFFGLSLPFWFLALMGFVSGIGDYVVYIGLPFLAVAAVLTYFGWHYLQQDARLDARRENIEHDIIVLAKKRDGKLTVSDVMELRVNERTARKLLDGLMRRGVCDINLDDVERTGLITYYFYDYSSDYKAKMKKLAKK